MVPRVRTRAHACSRVRNRCLDLDAFTHRSANKHRQRAAAYTAWCLRYARSQVVSGGVTHSAARHAVAGDTTPRSRSRITARTGAKPAAATRAYWREQVRTGRHTCGLVPARARGCAAGAAFQTMLQMARLTSWRNLRLVITRCTRSTRVAESCREARGTLLPTPATAWLVKRFDIAAASVRQRAAAKLAAATRVHQREQVRTGCHGCASVPQGP
jgi:hypothetical protein